MKTRGLISTALIALGVGCAHGRTQQATMGVQQQQKPPEQKAPQEAPKPAVPEPKGAPEQKPAQQLADAQPGERARRLLDEALLAQKSEEKLGAAQLAERFKTAADASEAAGAARFDQAVALDRAGQTDEAEKTYLVVAQGQGELAFRAAERAAAIAAARGDVQAARAALGLADRALPADEVRPKLLRAELELAAGDAAAAQAAAREILAKRPKEVRALCALARAHLKLGNVGTARILAGRAAQNDPHDADPLLVKAEIARHENEPAAELAAARAAAEADEESPEAALALGRALFERAQLGEAVDQLVRAADLDPGSFAAQLALGRAYLAGGQRPEAQQALGRAMALSPKAAEPHLELARLKLDGDGDAHAALEEAKLFLKLATQTPPPGHPIHALLQRCEEAIKNPAQASVVQGK